MRRNLIFTGQWLATALILAIGLSAYGCADTASVSEDVAAPLSSLTVTPGTLQPAFFANTTNYAVNAPTSVFNVTVTAVPKDITATVTIDGIVATQRSVPLGGPGSTKTILIVVETQTGHATTYTVTVTRLLSSDNNLSALSVTPGAMSPPNFDANILNYTVNVQTNFTSVTVTATKSDKDATMVISSAANSVTVAPGFNPGQLLITLGDPGTTTPVTIEVTAPNGNKKTYQITIKRLSGDNNLSALTVTPPGNFPPPGFVPSTLNYTVDVATNVSSVTVSATKSDPNAVMLIGAVTVPAGTASGQETFPLNGAGGPPTPISVTVTAQNGVDAKTYTITVNRPSSDDKLKALSVSAGSLNPSFVDPNILGYTVDGATDVPSVTVTAFKSDLNAVMLIGSVIVPAGTESGQVLVQTGINTTVTIIVTAQNGVDSKTYTVTVP